MKLFQGPLCTPYTHVLCGIERYSIVVCHPIKRTNQIFCGSPDDNETYINTIQQTASCSCYRGRTLFTDFPFQKKRPTPVQNGVKVFLKLCYIFEKFRYSRKPQKLEKKNPNLLLLLLQRKESIHQPNVQPHISDIGGNFPCFFPQFFWLKVS